MGYYKGHENGKSGCLADQASAREKARIVYIKVKEKADENIDQNNNYGDCGLILTACTSTTPSPLLLSPSRQPPASLISLCPDLPEARDGRLATLLRNSLERSVLYYECQAKHKALMKWVKTADK